MGLEGEERTRRSSYCDTVLSFTHRLLEHSAAFILLHQLAVQMNRNKDLLGVVTVAEGGQKTYVLIHSAAVNCRHCIRWFMDLEHDWIPF